jgi:uncharacterized protein YggE
MRFLLPLAAALATAVPAAAQQPPMMLTGVPAETLLTVAATGESTRKPDMATISAGVMVQSPDARTAMQQNAERMSRVVAELKRAGIAGRDIQTAQISLDPQFRYRENELPELVAYRATNTVSVKLRDLKKAGDVIDALVKEGANQISGPQFALDDADAAENEARMDAMKAARARADLYAKAAGMRVKRIVSITEGAAPQPPYPMPVMRMEAAAKADSSTEVAVGELTTTANLTVVFELE